MIQSKDFVNFLRSFGLSQFLMVPCSIFKPLTSWMLKNKIDLIFPPNEAHAMGFAVGSFLTSGKPAVIFLQNAGLNNLANIQTSLNLLYKIPVLLVVSWRGEPGKKDAPEHLMMGKIMKDFLKILQIPFVVLSDKWQKELKKMIKRVKKRKIPVAVVIREGFFEKEESLNGDLTEKYPLSRIRAIEIIKKNLKEEAIFISTTGFISRDSFAVLPTPDFYMMGSMGHAFSIGAGVAWQLQQKKSESKTVILDGDGGCLMHLGSLSLIGLKEIKKSGLIYILLDNEACESTGSQPTLSSGINFLKLAEGLGFPQCFFVTSSNELVKVLRQIKPHLAAFIHIKINRKRTKESIRVSDRYSCEEIGEKFMLHLKKKK